MLCIYTHELQGCIFSYKNSTGVTNFKVMTLALNFTDVEAHIHDCYSQLGKMAWVVDNMGSSRSKSPG